MDSQPTLPDELAEANEADVVEQQQGMDPDPAAGTGSSLDLGADLDVANEADLVEQAQEVPFDDDER
jgi:hypothetical protein